MVCKKVHFTQMTFLNEIFCTFIQDIILGHRYYKKQNVIDVKFWPTIQLLGKILAQGQTYVPTPVLVTYLTHSVTPQLSIRAGVHVQVATTSCISIKVRQCASTPLLPLHHMAVNSA